MENKKIYGEIETLDYDGMLKAWPDKMPDTAIIEIINSEFNRNYPLTAEVERLRTESKKRTSDYLVSVDCEVYHFEFQTSEDGTMSFRIFEYGVQSAVQHGREDSANGVELTFPNPVVYYIRDTENTPTEFTVTLKFPQGVELVNETTVQYKIPARRARDYTPTELAEQFKPLLMPFKQLNRRKKLNAGNLDEFSKEFKENINAIFLLEQTGKLPPNIANSMLDAVQELADRIVNESNISDKEKAVKDMSGIVVDERGELRFPNYLKIYEDYDRAKSAFIAERAKAEAEAKAKADAKAKAANARTSLVIALLSSGIDEKTIVTDYDISIEYIRKVTEDENNKKLIEARSKRYEEQRRGKKPGSRKL
jgi:hypothetical protein